MEEVVDKLEADHRKMANYISEINDVTRDLLKDDTPDRRNTTVESLNRLADHLLEHLSYEEEAIGPTVRSWDRLPVG
jgi:hemerythrin-like domain-containing protein